MILLSGLKVLSSNSSIASGGVIGNGSICSASGGHIGIDGVTGVGSEALYVNAMLMLPPVLVVQYSGMSSCSPNVSFLGNAINHDTVECK